MTGFKSLWDELINGKHSEIVRYVIFGALNVLVTWVQYAAFVLISVDPVYSNAISWVIGVLVAFVCNKFWVFDSKSLETRKVGTEFVSFIGGRILTGAVAIFGFPIIYQLGLNQAIFGVDGFFAKIIVSVIEIGLNFVISKYIVFKKKN